MVACYRRDARSDQHHRDCCEWLAEHVGVGAVPGSCFFREDVHHLIRFHFAKRDDTLNAALDRLSELDRKAKDYLR